MMNQEIRKYQKINVDKVQKYYEKLAKISFAVFLFFVFFGTSIPFRERTRDIGEITTSNPVNQLVYGALFIISIVIIYSRKREALEFIKREKFFFIFLAWCFLTVLWSDHSFVSFKRYIQFLTTVTIPLSFFIYSKNSEKAIRIFYYILAAYVIVSIATIFTIPMARNEYGIWRGIHTDKNGFGQICLMALILFCINYPRSVSLKDKVINLFFILSSFVLLIGARSTTALLTLIILVIIWILFQVDKIFEPIGIRKTISVLLTLGGIILVVLILNFLPEKIESAVGVTGKDLTFTGRVDIWKDIWNYAEDHFFWGAGFRGFWVINSPRLEELYQIYIWLPIQSHNGYLDLLNEVGAIGAVLFLLMLVNYVINTSKVKKKQVWKWFIFATLIMNITETSIIAPKSVSGVLFIFSYLALFKDLLFVEDSESAEKKVRSQLSSRYSSLKIYRH
jgi:O-antigen ligase